MKNKYLEKEAYQFIRPTAAATPTLYGLPKLYKENTPMRPVLASKNCFNYQAAVWRNNIPTPFREHSSVSKDTFSFVKLISKIPQLNQKFLVCFDVKSLFTNNNKKSNTYINKHKGIQNVFQSLVHLGYPKSFINKNI